jgi:hypothetical protein
MEIAGADRGFDLGLGVDSSPPGLPHALPLQTVRPGVTALQEKTARPLSFAQERIAHRLGLPT